MTHSVVESPFWEAGSHSNGDENPLILWNRRFITIFTRGQYFNLSQQTGIQSTSLQCISLRLILYYPTVCTYIILVVCTSHTFRLKHINCSCHPFQPRCLYLSKCKSHISQHDVCFFCNILFLYPTQHHNDNALKFRFFLFFVKVQIFLFVKSNSTFYKHTLQNVSISQYVFRRMLMQEKFILTFQKLNTFLTIMCIQTVHVMHTNS